MVAPLERGCAAQRSQPESRARRRGTQRRPDRRLVDPALKCDARESACKSKDWIRPRAKKVQRRVTGRKRCRDQTTKASARRDRPSGCFSFFVRYELLRVRRPFVEHAVAHRQERRSEEESDHSESHRTAKYTEYNQDQRRVTPATGDQKRPHDMIEVAHDHNPYCNQDCPLG